MSTYLAKVDGEEIPLGADDVVEYLSQYGTVHRGKRENLFFLFSFGGPEPVYLPRDAYPTHDGYDLMASTRNDRWYFCIWKGRDTRLDNCRDDLTGAVALFQELTHVPS